MVKLILSKNDTDFIGKSFASNIPNPKHVPVTTFIAVSIIVVFLLFNAQVITSVPCGKTVYDVFMSNFVHIDAIHLIFNLYALYRISRVEQEMGFKPFIWLIIFLLIFNTIAELIFRNIWKKSKCSIGFSGILFGLFTWELMSKKEFDIKLLIITVLMVITPSIKNKNVSLVGHAIGAVSGIVSAVIWKSIN